MAAAKQSLDHARGLQRQSPLRDFGNDGMPLLAPGESVARERAGEYR
jgi:hypothetical protein